MGRNKKNILRLDVAVNDAPVVAIPQPSDPDLVTQSNDTEKRWTYPLTDRAVDPHARG